jgi:hypothetical protein
VSVFDRQGLDADQARALTDLIKEHRKELALRLGAAALDFIDHVLVPELERLSRRHLAAVPPAAGFAWTSAAAKSIWQHVVQLNAREDARVGSGNRHLPFTEPEIDAMEAWLEDNPGGKPQKLYEGTGVPLRKTRRYVPWRADLIARGRWAPPT